LCIALKLVSLVLRAPPGTISWRRHCKERLRSRTSWRRRV